MTIRIWVDRGVEISETVDIPDEYPEWKKTAVIEQNAAALLLNVIPWGWSEVEPDAPEAA